MQPGALVKPLNDRTWRLGVVESIEPDGRLMVRAYVAPEGAYAGSSAVYRAEEIVEVTRADVEGALATTRARIAKEQQLERQIVAALAATP